MKLSNRRIIKGSKIILENEVLKDHVIVFTDKIEEILPESKASNIEGQWIRHEGFISPGFIDIHIHGAAGADTMDCSVDSIRTIANALVATGTTGFLATTMTMEQSVIESSIDTVRRFMEIQKNIEIQSIECDSREKVRNTGARVLGVHLEGPFINPLYKGAQDEKYIQKPTLSWIEKYLDVIKIITLAPEMDDNFQFISALKEKDVVLSMGHTACDFETACAAFDKGVDHVTHCFNAMTGLHHRRPGAVGAALTKPFTVDIITDGIHIHPDFLETFVRMKSVEKTILITDAIRATFLDEGEYDLGGQRVFVSKGGCKLEDGTIAGSILRMDTALSNMMKHTSLKLEEVVQMLSSNPARKLGIYDKKGSIEKGKDSDLVLLSEELEVESVFIGGRKEFAGGKL